MSQNEPTPSRFAVPDLEEMPGDIRERIEAVQEKSGFIPNVFLALAHRPDEFRAFFAHHDGVGSACFQADKGHEGFKTLLYVSAWRSIVWDPVTTVEPEYMVNANDAAVTHGLAQDAAECAVVVSGELFRCQCCQVPVLTFGAQMIGWGPH